MCNYFELYNAEYRGALINYFNIDNQMLHGLSKKNRGGNINSTFANVHLSLIINDLNCSYYISTVLIYNFVRQPFDYFNNTIITSRLRLYCSLNLSLEDFYDLLLTIFCLSRHNYLKFYLIQTGIILFINQILRVIKMNNTHCFK